MSIEVLAEKIPGSLHSRSGKVFYSGRDAFSKQARLYVLGVNPGGAPADHAAETIGSHTHDVLYSLPENWSAYRDESWSGHRRGTYGMAPRVLHLFARLGLDPGTVPCSNLVFVRSRREADIRAESDLANICWPFHSAAIQILQPKTILCFGKTVGSYVQQRINAHQLRAEFIENNVRRWRSQVFDSTLGIVVIVATHPSIADWTVKATDPTELVRDSMV